LSQLQSLKIKKFTKSQPQNVYGSEDNMFMFFFCLFILCVCVFFLDGFSAGPSEYKKRKVNEHCGWQEIQSALLTTRIEGLVPESGVCAVCGNSVPEPIICPDCGPNATFCQVCNKSFHCVALYHQGYVWSEVREI
jgi:hypothetical protein